MSGWLVEFSHLSEWEKNARRHFFLSRGLWVNVLLSKRKEAAVHFATVNTAVIQRNATSALQAGAYGRQPSSSPAQSPDPAANLSSGLGNFWPVKNHPVHSSLRTLWLLWLVYCKFWLISNSNSQFQQGYFSSLKKKKINWLVFVLLIQIQSLLPIKTNTLWMF